METLEFVKHQREVDAAIAAGDRVLAENLARQLNAGGQLSAVQGRLLKRSLAKLDESPARNGSLSSDSGPAVHDSRIQIEDGAPKSRGSRVIESPVSKRLAEIKARHQRPEPPKESETIEALAAMETGHGSQVSGLLRQLPQSDLADEIAKHILDLRYENERLSKRMVAVPAEQPTAHMEVVTPDENEIIGQPKGARTRLFERKHSEKNAPESNVPLGMQDVSAVQPATKRPTGPVAPPAGHDDSEHQLPLANLSPASRRQAPTLAPPPEHLDPTPPPPNWLTSKRFKKLLILIPIVLLIGLVWFGVSLFNGGDMPALEAKLDSATPTIAGINIDDSFESARESLRELAKEEPPPGDDPRSVYSQATLGVRLVPIDGKDQIRELRLSAGPTAWRIFTKSNQPAITIGTPSELTTIEPILKAASFVKLPSDEGAESVVFQRVYENEIVRIEYRFADNVNLGKIALLTIKRKD